MAASASIAVAALSIALAVPPGATVQMPGEVADGLGRRRQVQPPRAEWKRHAVDTRTNHRNSRRGGPVATLGVALACTTSASDGGSAITTHRYSLDAGLTWTNRSPAGADSPVAIGGLTNCARYRVGLRAVNSVGAAAASVTVSNTAGRGGVDAALQSGT